MFDVPFFADPKTLLLGALTGLVFGFLLHKGSVTRFDTITGQFLLQDFTVLKVMVTAMVVGGAGVFGMLQLGMIEGLHVKSAELLANGLGGAIFGVGMATLGYCPGTGVAAIGSGSKDAIFGVAGMVAGSMLYAEAYPFASTHVLTVGAFGKVTLPSITGLSPWWFLAAVAVLAIAGFSLLERKAARAPAPRRT